MRTTEEKSEIKNSVGRLIFVLLSLIIQVMWIVALFVRLNEYYAPLSLLTTIIALALVLRINGKHQLAEFKLPWIILIMAFPVLGVCLYLLMGHKDVTKRMRERFEKIDPKLLSELHQDPVVMEELEKTKSCRVWK